MGIIAQAVGAPGCKNEHVRERVPLSEPYAPRRTADERVFEARLRVALIRKEIAALGIAVPELEATLHVIEEELAYAAQPSAPGSQGAPGRGRALDRVEQELELAELRAEKLPLIVDGGFDPPEPPANPRATDIPNGSVAESPDIFAQCAKAECIGRHGRGPLVPGLPCRSRDTQKVECVCGPELCPASTHELLCLTSEECRPSEETSVTDYGACVPAVVGPRVCDYGNVHKRKLREAETFISRLQVDFSGPFVEAGDAMALVEALRRTYGTRRFSKAIRKKPLMHRAFCAGRAAYVEAYGEENFRTMAREHCKLVNAAVRDRRRRRATRYNQGLREGVRHRLSEVAHRGLHNAAG